MDEPLREMDSLPSKNNEGSGNNRSGYVSGDLHPTSVRSDPIVVDRPSGKAMNENGERLARIEERVSSLEKRMDKSEDDRGIIHSLLEQIRDTQIGQKTFIGGIVFAIGALWAILQVSWDTLRGHFK